VLRVGLKLADMLIQIKVIVQTTEKPNLECVEWDATVRYVIHLSKYNSDTMELGVG
jgi:hypothetical protein